MVTYGPSGDTSVCHPSPYEALGVVVITMKSYEEVIADTKAEFPDFKVIKKADSRLMSAIGGFLWLVTFGQQNTFMRNYTTTLGNTVYTPTSWEERSDESRTITLRHERVHMRQAKKHGQLLFSLMYLLWPLPVLWASARVRFEQEAYEESIRALVERDGIETVMQNVELKERTIGHFVSADYFWSSIDRKEIEAWYREVLMRLQDELNLKKVQTELEKL